MLRLVDAEASRQEFFAACQGTVFGCKLAAVAEAYGFGYPFARFWAGEGAACGLLDGQLTWAGALQDREEVRAFLRLAGPRQVFIRADLGRQLGLAAQSEGAVLEKRLPGQARDLPPPGENLRIGEVHGLLQRAGMPLPLEPFYLDLSHRLRHGAALVVEERREEALLGCAVISAVTGKAALLSALAVEESCRRKGAGTRLVQRAQALLKGRTLYVLRESGRNREFYHKLGFAETGRWMQA